MPRQRLQQVPVEVLNDVARSFGHAEATCRSCRHLEPTGERDYAWCGQHSRPQFQLGVCSGWQASESAWVDFWAETAPLYEIGSDWGL